MNKLRNAHQISRFSVLTLCVFLLIIYVNTLSAKMITPHPDFKSVTLEDAEKSFEKGIKLMDENKLDSAFMYLSVVANEAAQGTSTADSIVAMKAFNKCGVINFLNKNYQGAYSNFKKAIQAGGEKHSYWVNSNIAIILSMYGANDDSEKLFIKTYNNAKEASDWPHLITAYSNLLNHCFLNNRLKSINNIIKEFPTLKMPREKDALYFGDITEGMLHVNNKEYNEAISHFKKAYNLADITYHPDRARIDCDTYIAQTFRQAGRLDSAIYYLNNAMKLGQGDGLGDHLVDLYRLTAECYTDLNQPGLAKDYMLRHFALKDSISSMNDFSAIKNLDLNYEVGNYENKIVQVNKEKEQSQRYLLIISLAMIVFIVLFIIVIVQNGRLKASNKSLFEKNIEVLKASDAERAYYLETNNQESENKDKNNSRSQEKEEITSEEDSDENDSSSGSARLKIPMAEQMRIKHAIEQFFYSSDEWMQVDFGLPRLCEIVGSNKLYVSQVINDVMGTNFHTLLNRHRINEARRRLLDVTNYGGMTIEAIAESLGYKSRSNFSKNFKKYTGLNPKEYVIFAKSNPKLEEEEMIEPAL